MGASQRTFTVSGRNISLAARAGISLAILRPDTDYAFEALRCWANQRGTGTSEQLEISWGIQATAFGTYISATPRPATIGQTSKMIGGTSGALGSAGINTTTEGAGARTFHHDEAFNNLNGFLLIWTPEERPKVEANDANGLILFLQVQPTTLTGWNFGVTFQEL